jgi:uncharacterized protein YidB (DUF937 family)
MGLLDALLGAALGGNREQTQAQDPLSSIFGGLTGGRGAGAGIGGSLLLQLALMMLQRNGGLDGVLGKFRQAGMGAQADSWVSNGQNMNLSPDQLQEVFGSGSINDIASQLGMSQSQTGSAMSQMLPELINQLTPQGQVTSEGNNSIAEALESLAQSPGRQNYR